ncbi:MAG: hypothetical protein ACLFUB_07240 [Cyclobacteriaceae bacterium]
MTDKKEVGSSQMGKSMLNWSELPEGFRKLLSRSYHEYKEILYDPYLHPSARKIPSWEQWLRKHDIHLDVEES